MHRHSGGRRRDPFFAEIQYRGQRPSICESEKRDASGCLRKVLRLPRSFFSKSSCPKLTPHISDGFCPRRGDFKQEVKLTYPKLACFSCRAAERAAPRRHPRRKLRSETALPHCCLLPRKSTRPSCAAKVGRDCLRRCPFASSWLRSAVLPVILSIEQIEQTMRETTRQAKPNPSSMRGGTCGHPD